MVHWDQDMSFVNGVPAAGQWHHIAVTHDNGTEKAYIDGVLDQTKTVSLTIYANDPVRLGNADGTVYLSGSLAGVQMYDNALGEAQIARLAKSPDSSIAGALVNLQAAGLSYTDSSVVWTNSGAVGGRFSSAGQKLLSAESGLFGIGAVASLPITLRMSGLPLRFSMAGRGLMFTEPDAGYRQVTLYALNGVQIRRLPVVNAAVRWDGLDSHGQQAPAGLYVVALSGASGHVFKKMIIAR
jgi:hypothetical protein